MRRDSDGEAFCHNPADLRHCLMLRDLEGDDVYAVEEIEEAGVLPCVEINSLDGDRLICYVEGSSMERVKKIIAEVEIECPE